MQTMDMIIVKKKRIALAKRGNALSNGSQNRNQHGLWGILRTVTSSVKGSSESILFNFQNFAPFKFSYFVILCFILYKTSYFVHESSARRN